MDPAREAHKIRLADMIERRSKDIIERWLERVNVGVGITGIPLTDLQNALPDYLSKIRDELRTSTITFEQSGASAWRAVAREHALARVRLGFDIEQLLHEFAVLRRVLHELAQEEGLVEGHQPPILAELIEGAIAVAVHTYVEARDYNSRRVEAEHIGFVTMSRISSPSPR